MKKKMKTRKKMKMLATPDVCVKVFGMLVLSCAIGHAQGSTHIAQARKHHARNIHPRMIDIVQSLSESSTNATHSSYAKMFAKFQGTRHVKRVLAVGDSLTEGYIAGGYHYYPYTTKLEHQLNEAFNYTRFEVLNEGISSKSSSKKLVEKMPEILDREKGRISFVIIAFGSNEFRKQRCDQKSTTVDNIIKLHKMAHKAGLTTVVTTIPGCLDLHRTCQKARCRANKRLRAYVMRNKDNTLLCDLASELPMVSLFDFDRKVYWDDCVHPSRIGYEKLADLLYHVVRPAIDERSKVLFTG